MPHKGARLPTAIGGQDVHAAATLNVIRTLPPLGVNIAPNSRTPSAPFPDCSWITKKAVRGRSFLRIVATDTRIPIDIKVPSDRSRESSLTDKTRSNETPSRSTTLRPRERRQESSCDRRRFDNSGEDTVRRRGSSPGPWVRQEEWVTGAARYFSLLEEPRVKACGGYRRWRSCLGRTDLVSRSRGIFSNLSHEKLRFISNKL